MSARRPTPSDLSEAFGPRDRASLDAAGFLHIRGAAGPEAVETMREAWTQAMGKPAPTPRGNNDGPNGLEQMAAFAPCLEHPHVMGAVAHLLDGDVVLLGFHGREPRKGSGQQGFHVDDARPTLPGRQRIANAFWILDDMDASNGATRVVPGSHRLGRLPGKDLTDREAQHPEQLIIPARAGDAVVFTAHLWHAGSQNHSGARRRIAMAHFGRREMVRPQADAGRVTTGDGGDGGCDRD